MKRIRSFGDFYRSCDGLIRACELNSVLLPGVELLKEELRTLLNQAQELKDTQEHLTGLRKGVTQRLDWTLDDAKEAARKLRSFIKTRMHSRSEQLTQFGILPNRSRPRKRRPAKETGNPAADGEATAPETATEQ
ncbi:MAG TPA: hypothetical protein VGX68_18800 [Thermoanaerobaculia bacterium]|jgi:hypothetical protein|nr:hypothetical protein [Thermoanaerobaculia bacterium]